MPTDLLAALRAASPTDLKAARQAFYVAYQHLIDAVLSPDKQTKEIDLYQTLFEGLAVATERLRKNEVPLDKVETYILDELKSMEVEHYRRGSRNILSPQGSKCPNLKRNDDENLLDIASTTTVSGRKQRGEYIPSRLDTAKPADDLKEHVTMNELQRRVLDLLLAGYSETKVAELLCITQYRVSEIRNTFCARAEAAGYRPDKKRKAG
jgi:hypothetical protein